MSTFSGLVERMKEEILRDVIDGIVPEGVQSFSELHDYVDANMYGIEDEDVDVINEAQDKVDDWIQFGGLTNDLYWRTI